MVSTKKKHSLQKMTIPAGCNLIPYFETLSKTKAYTEDMCNRLISEGKINVLKDLDNENGNQIFIVERNEKPIFELEVYEDVNQNILMISLNYAAIIKDNQLSLFRDNCTLCRLKKVGNKQVCIRDTFVNSM